MMTTLIRRLFVLMFLLAISGACLAHGFGEQLDLKIPMWLWLGGAGLTVVLSFAVVIDFLPDKFSTTQYPQIDVSDSVLPRVIFHPINLWFGRSLVLALLFITIIAGIIGNQTPEKNLAPTIIWIAFWVGMTFLASLLGNFWRSLNPFATLYLLLFMPVAAERNETETSRLDAWPAVIVLIIFMFVEHLWPFNDRPLYLSVLVSTYFLFTLAMMKKYGPADWLANGEVFSVTFEIFGRFAPIKYLLPSAGRPSVFIRPPAVGLLDNRPTSTPLMMFVFVLLAGVTFDGLMDIPQWQSFLFSYGVTFSHYLDINVFIFGSNLVLMLVLPAVFLLFFWLACVATQRLLGAGNTADSWVLMRSYVMTLIPIAIAYHFAHYLTLLLIEGQLIMPLASDPFGRGWDIFSTRAYQPDPKLFSSEFVWYFVVVAIVIGHMLSVYLAHLVTLTFSDNKSTAVKAGTPILLLMVFYTVISLWVIAQPALSA